MYARKLLSLVSTAVFAVVMLAGCGGSNFSSAAAKAANKAQSTVVFETDARLTNSLQDALEASADPTAIRQAMVEDDNMDELLKSGYRLDVLTVGGSDGDAAADALAEYIKTIVSGREKEGYISLVKADNGSFYAAILTYRNGGSGGGSGSGGGTTGGDSGEQGGSGEGGGDIDDENKPATLDHIEVRPASTWDYVVGQEFKPEGMVVVAHYTDGTHKTVTDYSISCALFGWPNTFKEAGHTEIVVNYQGETAAFSVTVWPLTVDYIEISGKYETNYVAGQDFDADGMTVTAYYNDGSYRKLGNSEYEFDNNKNLQPGNQTVTIKYTDDTGKTVTADIPVTVASGDKVETVTVTNSKEDYYVGDKFDETAVEVTVTLSNGETKTAALTDPKCEYTITPDVDEDNLKTPGRYTIKVTYDGVEAENTVGFSVTTVVLTGIRVETNDSFQKEYQVGGSFNPTGMKVYATYNHGPEKEIALDNDNLKISVEDHNSEKGFESSGTKTIKVSYTEGDVTKTNSDVKVTVNKPKPETYTVSVTAKNGKAEKDSYTVKAGESLTFIVTPNTGYEYEKVEAKDGDGNPITVTHDGNSYTIDRVNSGICVTVTFKAIPKYTVTVSCDNDKGTATPTKGSVEAGKTFTFSVKPETGWKVKGAEASNGAKVTSNGTNNFIVENITAATTVTVKFEKAEITEIKIDDDQLTSYEADYWDNQCLNLRGLKLTVVYEDGNSESISVSDAKVEWVGQRNGQKENMYLGWNDPGLKGWWRATFKITYENKTTYFDAFVHCGSKKYDGYNCCKYWDGNPTRLHR